MPRTIESHSFYGSRSLRRFLASSQLRKQVTIGFTNPTGTAALPYVMAEKKGFFKKEGVNAVIVIMQNQVVVNGVVSRSLDYGGTIANFIGAVREGFYGDMLGLYTRTGIVSDETIANVVRFTRATRKSQENISVAEITDWTFAKKANEELSR